MAAQKRAAKKKAKEVKAWAHQNVETGKLSWIGTPNMSRRHAGICKFANEKIVRVSIRFCSHG